jgi:hypothetical protein
MHAGGRPSKRTEELEDQICHGIASGLTNRETAALVGINVDTLYEWLKDEEFADKIEGSCAARTLVRIERVESGAKGWEASAWILERFSPERFARPEIRLQFQMRDNAQTLSMGPNEARLRQQIEERRMLKATNAQP